MEDDTKICPYCAEPIKKEAIYCRFCESNLSTHTENKSTIEANKANDKQLGWGAGCGLIFGMILVAAIGIILLMFFLFHISPEDSPLKRSW